MPGRSVFNLSVTRRPRGSEPIGRREKQKNKKQRGGLIVRLKYIKSEYPPAGPQTNLRPLAWLRRHSRHQNHVVDAGAATFRLTCWSSEPCLKRPACASTSTSTGHQHAVRNEEGSKRSDLTRRAATLSQRFARGAKVSRHKLVWRVVGGVLPRNAELSSLSPTVERLRTALFLFL